MYNINPKLWGNPLWKFIHYLTVAYPENPTQEQMDDFKLFFTHLKKMLPCEKCRYHYQQNLLKYPLTDDILRSRYKLIKWAVDMHNEVNVMNGKPKMSVERVIDEYTKDKGAIRMDKNVFNIVVLIMIIILVIWFYKYKNPS
uniref:thiol oxidase n=1 Tax=viral metagenome TaxID=1070528 RepID=A0A6C0EAG7_9ZZZZ